MFPVWQHSRLSRTFPSPLSLCCLSSFGPVLFPRFRAHSASWRPVLRQCPFPCRVGHRLLPHLQYEALLPLHNCGCGIFVPWWSGRQQDLWVTIHQLLLQGCGGNGKHTRHISAWRHILSQVLGKTVVCSPCQQEPLEQAGTKRLLQHPMDLLLEHRTSLPVIIRTNHDDQTGSSFSVYTEIFRAKCEYALETNSSK